VGLGCPLAFTGTACQTSVVAGLPASVVEQQCEGYRARNYGFGIFAYRCYFDPTALTVVAAEYFDDAPRFCGQSHGITYGVVPPAGTCDPAVTVVQPCLPDAATD
jgi:hypothetical protein